MKYRSLISQMTLAEKCSLLSGKSQFESKSLEHLGIPSIFFSDGPHGIRKQAGSSDHLGLNESLPATCYPVAATVANSWDIELAEEVGRYLGEEAYHQRVSVLLGPGLNIKRNPLCGRNFEYFSEDPYLSGKMAAAYIRGIQSQGVAACPKHFAVNSQETFRMASNSVLDERTLREIYLTGFEIAVTEGKPKAIMTSYNLVNGIYANENRKLLDDILKQEWGFDGMVVTDWGGSNDRVEGFIAGNHIEMPGTKGNSDREIAAAVKSGVISEELLDQRVDELLSVWMDVTMPNGNLTFNHEEHHKFARKAAAQSIVLLKNEIYQEQEKILPLKAGTKVGVIGEFADQPRYQGAGSSLVNSTRVDRMTELLAESSLEYIGYAPGFDRGGKRDDEKTAAALKLAEKSEIVLMYMGLDETSETEGQDRFHMKMNRNQSELLKAVAKVNPNIVIILSAGSVVEMPWESYAKGILHGYLGGQAGAGAMLEVLTGQVCPSGKLGETYPYVYGDVPGHKAFPVREAASEYREGIYVGYRYYEKAGIPVRYPFGYGLSYTTFAYSDLTIDEEVIHFYIENTGDCAGAEIAQMYISCANKDVFMPQKELKGFAKVFLEPGERKLVSIPLDQWSFRYFNVRTESFEELGGTYQIIIAASAAEMKLSQTVKRQGTGGALPYDKSRLSAYWSGQVAEVSDQEFFTLMEGKVFIETWTPDQLIERNHPIARLIDAKNPIARLAGKFIDHKRRTAEKKGKPDLNILFIYNMPFRGIAKMMGGMVDMSMTDAILTIVNGRFFKGCGQLIKAYRKMRKEQKGGIM